MSKAHEEGGDLTSSERLASAFLTLRIAEHTDDTKIEPTSGKNKIASSASGCTRRTRRFGRNLLTPDAARHGTVRSDAARQGTLRPDEECHGICVSDEECQSIFLSDAAVLFRRSCGFWTQRVASWLADAHYTLAI
jgi:hypothetical protein